METDTAFVRANGIVELHAIAQIGLHFTFVVHPSDTEREDTIGFHQTFNNLCLFEFRMLIVDIFDRKKYFLYGLKILRFTGMLCLQRGHNTFNIHNITF